MRHTFALTMRRAGVHEVVIREMTGHKTMAMFKRYNNTDSRKIRRWKLLRQASPFQVNNNLIC
ncbi:MAG: hypothetical protein ACOC6K_02225 [Thermodesulfobacteriota bacterium]